MKQKLSKQDMEKIAMWERRMCENAAAIAAMAETIKEIHYGASRKAMQGIIEYLIEKKPPPRLG